MGELALISLGVLLGLVWFKGLGLELGLGIGFGLGLRIRVRVWKG